MEQEKQPVALVLSQKDGRVVLSLQAEAGGMFVTMTTDEARRQAEQLRLFADRVDTGTATE